MSKPLLHNRPQKPGLQTMIEGPLYCVQVLQIKTVLTCGLSEGVEGVSGIKYVVSTSALSIHRP